MFLWKPPDPEKTFHGNYLCPQVSSGTTVVLGFSPVGRMSKSLTSIPFGDLLDTDACLNSMKAEKEQIVIPTCTEQVVGDLESPLRLLSDENSEFNMIVS